MARMRPSALEVPGQSNSGTATTRRWSPAASSPSPAGDGNDTLDAGTGGYVVNGGTGNDVIFGGSSGGSINSNFRNGGPGDDVIDAEGAPSTLGGSGADTFTGNGFTQQRLVYSDRTEPVFVGIDDGIGNDGEAGEGDTVLAGISDVAGGSGDDLLIGSDAHWEGLFGGGGDDIIDGGAGHNDGASGGDGDDLLIGDLGMNDRLAGGNDTDVADYSDRTAPVFLSTGTPLDDGETGEADAIEGDVESLFGGSGADQLSGGSGDDLLNGGPGADTLTGGPGFDLSDYGERTNAVIVDLDGQPGDDGEPGEGDTTAADVEDIGGGSGNDVLTGNGGEEFLFGWGGNDSLAGGGASDLLSGGDGDDTLASRDNVHDETNCGAGGGDSATIDWFDDVAGCEQAVGPAPHAATFMASEITETTAKLGGAVNPLGNATTVSWELGTTTAYGTRTASVSLGSSTPNTTVFKTVSGLTGGTTYHYRVVATNAGGTTYGADVTFRTAAAPPPPPPPPPPRRCVMPRVVGQQLVVARRRITRRLCRVREDHAAAVPRRAQGDRARTAAEGRDTAAARLEGLARRLERQAAEAQAALTTSPRTFTTL
jgi:hypothetical protein